MHPTVTKLRKEKRISLATWAKKNGFSHAYCSMVINGRRGLMDFGKSLEIVTALKSIGVWVEAKEEKRASEITDQTPPDYLKARVEAVNRAKDETVSKAVALTLTLARMEEAMGEESFREWLQTDDGREAWAAKAEMERFVMNQSGAENE